MTIPTPIRSRKIKTSLRREVEVIREGDDYFLAVSVELGEKMRAMLTPEEFSRFRDHCEWVRTGKESKKPRREDKKQPNGRRKGRRPRVQVGWRLPEDMVERLRDVADEEDDAVVRLVTRILDGWLNEREVV